MRKKCERLLSQSRASSRTFASYRSPHSIVLVESLRTEDLSRSLTATFNSPAARSSSFSIDDVKSTFARRSGSCIFPAFVKNPDPSSPLSAICGGGNSLPLTGSLYIVPFLASCALGLRDGSTRRADPGGSKRRAIQSRLDLAIARHCSELSDRLILMIGMREDLLRVPEPIPRCGFFRNSSILTHMRATLKVVFYVHILAVRVGFEPTEPVKVQRFSRPPDSTALAPHRFLTYQN